MRTYEALYIVRPDLKDDEIQTVANGVESLVTENAGTIVRSEIWGKRRLAYEVQKFNEGCYVLLRFTAVPTLVARLENHFRLTEAIIRYLVVHFSEHDLRLEEEQQKRKQDEIHPGAGGPARDGRRGAYRKRDSEDGERDTRRDEEE